MAVAARGVARIGPDADRGFRPCRGHVGRQQRAVVGVAAGVVRGLLPDGHRRRAGGHRRRHAVRAHRRQLLSVPPRLRARRRACWWPWPARWRPGRRCCAAASAACAWRCRWRCWRRRARSAARCSGWRCRRTWCRSLLGGVVLGIVVLMLVSKKSEFPQVEQPDALAQALALHGVFVDGASGRTVHWQVHRTVPGLLVFLGIGVLAGMFGIGAGWANVPALNLLMGAPLKVAAGTSSAGAVAGRLVGGVGLHQQGRSAADDRGAVGGRHDARRAHRCPAAQRAEGLGDPPHGDHGAAVRRRCARCSRAWEYGHDDSTEAVGRSRPSNCVTRACSTGVPRSACVVLVAELRGLPDWA